MQNSTHTQSLSKRKLAASLTRLATALPVVAVIPLAMVLNLGLASALAAQESIEIKNAVANAIDNVNLPAEESGVIRRFEVKEGEFVQVDTVLAALSADLQMQQVMVSKLELMAAELEASDDSDIEYAEKTTEMSRKTLERSIQANSRSDRSVSKTEIERLKLEYERGVLAKRRAELDAEIANARLEIKKAQLEVSKLKMRQRVIVSPIQGIVAEKLAQTGEWVSAGQPIIRVVGMNRLRVKCILEADLYDASLVGKQVEFTCKVAPDGELMTFEGVVTFVSPEILLQRNQISVWAEVENKDMKLRPNSSGLLRILK